MPSSATRYDFETGVFRPPSEGGSYSLLVRFTRNCPWNHCEFCAMYKNERFQLRSVDEIKQDIDAIAALCNDLRALSRKTDRGDGISHEAAIALIGRHPELNQHQGFAMVYHWLISGAKTAFIQDANSLIMPPDQLVAALAYLRATFPSLTRVTSYGRSRTLAQRKIEELRAIRESGLDRLHVGLETGDDTLLQRMKKGVTAAGHIEGGRKAMAAGFQLSEYWMPGLGGQELSEAHARHTAEVLNAINPHYIRSRPFNPLPGTSLENAVAQGRFQMLSPSAQLLELRQMIQALEVNSRVCFDHAANYWTDRQGNLLFTQAYEGYQFPQEKESVLERIEEGLRNDIRRPTLLNL